MKMREVIERARYRRERIMLMRRRGMTYQEIGEALGIRRQTAFRLAERAMQEASREPS